MKRMDEKRPGRRSMRRLILYAMFFCILLFLVVGLTGLSFLWENSKRCRQEIIEK